ncbi:hypothetical protein D3C80_1650770 [compost metagenome]
MRGDGQHFDVVLIRARLVKRMLFDLQLIQVENQQAKTGDDQHHRHAGTANEQRFFGGMVTERIF